MTSPENNSGLYGTVSSTTEKTRSNGNGAIDSDREHEHDPEHQDSGQFPLSRIESAVSVATQQYEATISRVRSRRSGQTRPFTHPLTHVQTDQDVVVDFDGPDDEYLPLNWEFRKKATTTFLYGMTTMGTSPLDRSPSLSVVDFFHCLVLLGLNDLKVLTGLPAIFLHCRFNMGERSVRKTTMNLLS